MAMTMAEKDLQSEVSGEGLVLGPLIALIISEAQAERGGDVDEPASERKRTLVASLVVVTGDQADFHL